MKKFKELNFVLLLSLLFCLFSVSPLAASPGFTTGKKYHIVSKQYPRGCVADGTSSAVQTPLCYLTTATTDAATYWQIEEQWLGTGYCTIRNAKTGQYVTYDGVRDTYRRYVSMTDAPEELNFNAVWYFEEQSEGVYTIRNASHTDHLWDVREGSYIVGTYSNNGAASLNQQFSFYDEEGNLVQERLAIDTGNGYDVSSWLNATAESPDGWTFTGISWTDPGFGYYNLDDAYISSPFLERWHDIWRGGLPDGEMSQTLKYMPSGSYTLTADMIAVRQAGNASDMGTPASGVFLFANGNQTAASTGSERPQHYAVDVTLEQTGELVVGARISNSNANWVAVDNYQLLFHGTEQELMEKEKEKIRAELSAFYSLSEINDLIAQSGKTFDNLEQLRKTAGAQVGADPLIRALTQLTIDGHTPVYVPSLDTYLCTLPLSNFGTTAKCTVGYTPREGSSKLSIDGTEVAPGTDYSFADVAAQRNYKFTATSADGVALSCNLTFTALPVVKITGDFSNYYSQGSIAVHQPDLQGSETLNMKAKWRGGITNGSNKHKRNYHVKLLDENGEKLERKFFGLRNDNSWILEANQVDMSRVRNRVLTDLWNDFSVKPYYIDKEPKAKTGTRGRFVELILNDDYRGIYSMTENMDRKQMKLKKYDDSLSVVHGQLWKSKDWSYAVFMGTNPDGNYYPRDFLSEPNGNSEMWDSYQVKYPSIEDVSPTDWTTLYDAVEFVCNSDDANFEHYLPGYFDLPLVVDYYILMETILSTDNHGKNLFFAVYDKKQSQRITLGVWDMDATTGQRWSDDYYHSNIMRPEQDYAEYISRMEHGDYNLFRRLRLTDAYNFNQKVRLRYRDLRETYLRTDALLNRFRTYLNEFKTCGADQREYTRWSGDTDIARKTLDFDVEMAYIEDWVTRRMEYLDSVRFDIGSLPPSGITDVNLGTKAHHAGIYTIGGRLVSKDYNERTLLNLPKGVYIVNGRKVVVGQ